MYEEIFIVNLNCVLHKFSEKLPFFGMRQNAVNAFPKRGQNVDWETSSSLKLIPSQVTISGFFPEISWTAKLKEYHLKP